MNIVLYFHSLVYQNKDDMAFANLSTEKERYIISHVKVHNYEENSEHILFRWVFTQEYKIKHDPLLYLTENQVSHQTLAYKAHWHP